VVAKIHASGRAPWNHPATFIPERGECRRCDRLGTTAHREYWCLVADATGESPSLGVKLPFFAPKFFATRRLPGAAAASLH
jgi:hypothetical protein